jgi:hypothetical protein
MCRCCGCLPLNTPRLQDLGAQCFYPCVEADEVDGLEGTVDPWVEGIIGALQQALQDIQQQQQQQQQAAGAAAPAAASAAPSAAASRPDSGASKAAAAELLPAQVSGSKAAVAASAAAPAAALAAGAAAGSPPATPPAQLVNGLAPEGVDLKGVPPLAPCRIALAVDSLPPAAAAAIRARDADGVPAREQRKLRDASGAYSAAAPFWATVSGAQ